MNKINKLEVNKGHRSWANKRQFIGKPKQDIKNVNSSAVFRKKIKEWNGDK